MGKDSMKAVVFKGPHKVVVEDRPVPRIKEQTDIIVKVDKVRCLLFPRCTLANHACTDGPMRQVSPTHLSRVQSWMNRQ